jgi:hypothetical protein
MTVGTYSIPAGTRARYAVAARVSRSDLTASLALVVVAVFLTWRTWARWGDLQIDCGREVYVPIAILKGKLLYRDLWYPYGPLAPYLQALLFLIFGVHLEVLYTFGSGLAVFGALVLFAIGKRLMPTPASFIVSLAYLMRGFVPFVFNLPFPYSYATLLGSQLGLTCVYFLVREARDEPGRNLLWAGIVAGIALATKQEFGIATYLAIGAFLVWRLIETRKWSNFASQGLALLPGLILAAAAYGWFAWRLSPSFILKENFLFSPGAYFMRIYGTQFLELGGFRFVPGEMLWLLASIGFCLAFWYGIAQAFRWAKERPFIVACFGAGVGLLGILVYRYFSSPNLLELCESVVFPKGLFAFGIIALIASMAGFPHDLGRQGRFALIVIAAYAIAAGIRVFANVTIYGYPIYYDSLLFALFVFVVTRVAVWVTRNTEPRWQHSTVSSLVVAEGIALCLLLRGGGSLPQHLLETPIGNIYTNRFESYQVPRIVAFMKKEAADGKHVLVLPEDSIFYAFADTESPTRWYTASPGILSPDDEREFIDQATSYGVDYILISNRAFPEYDVDFFGVSYCPVVFDWVMGNYKLVGQFGEFKPAWPGRFAMQIYAKQGEDPSNSEQMMFDQLDASSWRW